MTSTHTVYHGGTIHSSLHGTKFTREGYAEMKQLMNSVTGGIRDWLFFTTSSYSTDQAQELLGTLARQELRCIDNESCTFGRGLATEHYAQALRNRLQSFSDNSTFSYWEIEEFVESSTPRSCNGTYPDHEDSQCLVLIEGSVDDRLTCSHETYLRLQQPKTPCRLLNCGGMPGAVLIPNRCTKLAREGAKSKGESTTPLITPRRTEYYSGGGGIM